MSRPRAYTPATQALVNSIAKKPYDEAMRSIIELRRTGQGKNGSNPDEKRAKKLNELANDIEKSVEDLAHNPKKKLLEELIKKIKKLM